MRNFAMVTAAIALVACSADLRTEPRSVDDLFSEPVLSYTPDEEIVFGDRSMGATYGLPREDMSSIADVIAIFPEGGVRSDEPNVFTSAEVVFPTDQCRGGTPTVTTALPMVIEGVVTLHPRQYMKVEICGQDERHYGAFTIEDDTGGLVVLRDGRVANFSFGDRVRMTIHAVTLTFGLDADTRAVLVADMEVLPSVEQDVLYSPTTDPFDTTTVGYVKQVTGFVHVEPTALNFNSMLLTETPYARQPRDASYTGELLQCIRTCEVDCFDRCPSAEACADICPTECTRQGGTRIDDDSIPACWLIGIDAELGRRGFAPPYGTRVRATGPVVNNFDVQMWVISTGQVEQF